MTSASRPKVRSATTLRIAHSRAKPVYGVQRTLGDGNHRHDRDAEYIGRQSLGREISERTLLVALALSMTRSTPPW